MESKYTLVLSKDVYEFIKSIVESLGATEYEETYELEVDERLLTDAIVEIANAKETNDGIL